MSVPAIRHATGADLPRAQAMNDAAVPSVNRIAPQRMAWFLEQAAYFRIAETDGCVMAFLIALLPDTPYESANFQWFRARYERFVYVDRIVVDPAARGHGLGRRLYADLARFAASVAPRITCEVNLRPRNTGSLAFHARMGFMEVGRQETEQGTKEVSLMIWNLDHDTARSQGE